MQYFHILLKKVTYHDNTSSKELEWILKIPVLHIIAVVKGIVFFLNIFSAFSTLYFDLSPTLWSVKVARFGMSCNRDVLYWRYHSNPLLSMFAKSLFVNTQVDVGSRPLLHNLLLAAATVDRSLEPLCTRVNCCVYTLFVRNGSRFSWKSRSHDPYPPT